MLEYMDIDEKRFWEIIDNARSPHLWDKNEDGWFQQTCMERRFLNEFI